MIQLLIYTRCVEKTEVVSEQIPQVVLLWRIDIGLELIGSSYIGRARLKIYLARARARARFGGYPREKKEKEGKKGRKGGKKKEKKGKKGGENVGLCLKHV